MLFMAHNFTGFAPLYSAVDYAFACDWIGRRMMIETTNLQQRAVVCPDGVVRQLIGFDDKNNPQIATVVGEKGRGIAYKVEELEEYEQHKSR